MALDLTGRTFGRLTAIAREDGSRWRFKCACGVEKVLEARSVRYRKTLSCGCLRQIDIAPGHRFGRLTASHYVNHGKNGARWLFQCDCGSEDCRVQLRKEWPANFLRMPRSGHGRQDNRAKRSCLAVPQMAYNAQRLNWSRSASLRKAQLIAMDKGRSSQKIPLKTMLRTTRLSASSHERSGFSSMGTTLRICLSGGLPALADAIREFAE